MSQQDEANKDDNMLTTDFSSTARTKAEAQQQVERLLAEQLMERAPQQQADLAAEAVRKLPPKWEIRIQTTHDPVAEETRIYRQMAKEADDRYDRRRTPELNADTSAATNGNDKDHIE